MGRGLKRIQRRLNDQGMALIMTLLVLSIVLVITIQFTYSVRLEERVVSIQGDDLRLSLAARGAIWHVAAQMAADDEGVFKSGEHELDKVDSYAEPYLDPEAKESRSFEASGEEGAAIKISYAVEDLERRFNLNWLVAGSEDFQKHSKAALDRLIAQLGHPKELGEKLIEFVKSRQEGEQEPTNGAPVVKRSGEDDKVPPRALLSVDDLLELDFENIDLILDGTDEKGEPKEDVKPLKDFLCVWPTTGLNLNTALPEVILAWLPAKDQKKPKATELKGDPRIKATKELIKYRLHVEGDEEFETKAAPAEGEEAAPEGPAVPEPGGEEGKSGSEWIGKGPFKAIKELAKVDGLKFIFNSKSGEGPPKLAGGGASGGAGASSGPKNWYDVLTVTSRLYRVVITASAGEEAQKVLEAVIFRGNTEGEAKFETAVLEWREVED